MVAETRSNVEAEKGGVDTQTRPSRVSNVVARRGEEGAHECSGEATGWGARAFSPPNTTCTTGSLLIQGHSTQCAQRGLYCGRTPPWCGMLTAFAAKVSWHQLSSRHGCRQACHPHSRRRRPSVGDIGRSSAFQSGAFRKRGRGTTRDPTTAFGPAPPCAAAACCPACQRLRCVAVKDEGSHRRSNVASWRAAADVAEPLPSWSHRPGEEPPLSSAQFASAGGGGGHPPPAAAGRGCQRRGDGTVGGD